MPNILVEIGTEELPSRRSMSFTMSLRPELRQKLAEERIAFGEVTVEATPRRIAVFIRDIAVTQQDRVLEISGPLTKML